MKKLIEDVGCKLMFLLLYSPDLNPIGHYWAWLKKKIRDVVHRFDILDEALGYTMGKSIYHIALDYENHQLGLMM